MSSEKPRISSSSSTGSRRIPSRLQQRAPASLQIKPTSSSQWNVAIPLLSPLATSPTSPRLTDRTTAETKPTRQDSVSEPQKKPVVFKKWQHPAAPLGYDPVKHPFVPV